MKEANVIISLCVVSMSLFLPSARSQADDVTYQDLKDLGATCEPKDTCAGVTYGTDGSTRRDFYNSFDPFCDCGRLCIEYDTCCVNSPYRKYQTRYNRRRSNRYVCVRLNDQPRESFFMVGKCSSGWNGDREIRNKCHESNIRDPYSIIPAYDRRNNVTYRNFFCGICNRVEPDRLSLWNITIRKKSFQDIPEEELVENLTFDEESRSWGSWEEVDGMLRFMRVFIQINIPTDRHPKHCIADLVGDCDPDWSDSTISNKCKSYTAPIHAIKAGDSFARRYRNIHCAICNSAELVSDDFCHPPDIGEGFDFGEGGVSPPISLALLFDVNPKHGAHVGTISKCKARESYDPFFRKCRNLVCGIPGYVLKNGKCSKS